MNGWPLLVRPEFSLRESPECVALGGAGGCGRLLLQHSRYSYYN